MLRDNSSGGAGFIRRSSHLGDDVLSRRQRVREACGVGHPSPVRRQGRRRHDSGLGRLAARLAKKPIRLRFCSLKRPTGTRSRCGIQVFASDLDDSALAVAREGRYPVAIEADMTEERLRRFFTREGDHYRVTRELRDIVLFARHSLLKDPPFSRVDLISCRNVLIYLDREVQQPGLRHLPFRVATGRLPFSRIVRKRRQPSRSVPRA